MRYKITLLDEILLAKLFVCHVILRSELAFYLGNVYLVFSMIFVSLDR